MKHYVMIQRPELPADMQAALSRLDGRTGEQLTEAYNAESRLGFTGVYAQAIHVLALHQHLKAKFGSGPLVIEDNAVLTMSGPVRWDGVTWVPDGPGPDVVAQDNRYHGQPESKGTSTSRANGHWGPLASLVEWMQRRLNGLKSAFGTSEKPKVSSPSEADRAEFMRRKYAELMMAHNAWSEEQEEDDV